ncbi:YaaL family protein [Paenalkalicoccus suaedae]|uniref:YaaL family protein n=1 Tax=Paenalkalicoccus suaedae TaxID=2592382 RepID=A0A859F9T5_9BACI|nr:YaaL family protein [Paenalkalicoccus suaedae]QKS69617.1 YaaL family protein [Paenalkalicoccus suaedae]
MARGKKRKLRREVDDELIRRLDTIKRKADQHDSYLQHSFDAREDVIGRAKLERAKYYFLLKEARVRNTTFY